MSLSDAEMRAKRLLILRGMLGLSRDAIDRRYGIAKSTLQNWESARNALSEKGAVQIFNAYHAEKINFTMDWLLYGIGLDPTFANAAPHGNPNHSLPKALLPVRKHVINEVLLLRKLYPDLVDMAITDDSMSPHYPNACYIAGIKVFKPHIDTLQGDDCLIHAPGIGLVFRRLLPGSSTNLYHLAPINLIPDYPIITDAEVIFAARVFWVRSDEFVYSQ